MFIFIILILRYAKKYEIIFKLISNVFQKEH